MSAQSPSAAASPERGRPPRLKAKLERDFDVDSYRVTGTTPSAVFASIRRNGPGRWSGRAEWSITYSTQGELVNDRCYLAEAKVEVQVTLILPEWDRPPGASGEAAAAWRYTSEPLERHERGHQRLALNAGKELLRELSRLRRASDCSELYRRENKIYRRVYLASKRDQRNYDARTDHGLNQSAA